MAKQSDQSVAAHLGMDAYGSRLLTGRHVLVPTASVTLKKDQSGALVLVGTDALVITLPSAIEMEGMWFEFINIGADDACIITLSPNAVDGIFGTIPNAAADAVSGGVDDKDWVNTKTGANKGDRCVLISDGETGWYITSGVGVWASEG